MKLLLLSVLCISIVGCDSPRQESNKSSTDSIQQDTRPQQALEKQSKEADITDAQEEELDEEHLQKIEISKEDGGMWIAANMRMDHRIFGYAKQDTTSRKMILLSIFTSDVEGNPFRCPYGSYYESSGMNDKGMKLKYVAEEGDFIEANIIQGDTMQVPVYIEKKWVVFD